LIPVPLDRVPLGPYRSGLPRRWKHSRAGLRSISKSLWDDGKDGFEVAFFGESGIQGQLMTTQQPHEHPRRGHWNVVQLLEIQQQESIRKINQRGRTNLFRSLLVQDNLPNSSTLLLDGECQQASLRILWE
jgi:hypothetical protein